MQTCTIDPTNDAKLMCSIVSISACEVLEVFLKAGRYLDKIVTRLTHFEWQFGKEQRDSKLFHTARNCMTMEENL